MMSIHYPLTSDKQSFIRAWFLKDLSICDELIDFFSRNPNRRIGTVQTLFQSEPLVDRSVKDNEEVELHLEDQEPIFIKYLTGLQDLVNEYIEIFPEVNKQGAWSITEGTNIQYYRPNGGYKTWHCERSSYKHPNSSRHLVFMTYLNDVDDAGETEFLYQKTKIKPKKGLTVLWPADWTHTHRGIVSPTQEKYIITGWFNFIE